MVLLRAAWLWGRGSGGGARGAELPECSWPLPRPRRTGLSPRGAARICAVRRLWRLRGTQGQGRGRARSPRSTRHGAGHHAGLLRAHAAAFPVKRPHRRRPLGRRGEAGVPGGDGVRSPALGPKLPVPGGWRGRGPGQEKLPDSSRGREAPCARGRELRPADPRREDRGWLRAPGPFVCHSSPGDPCTNIPSFK